MSESLNQQVTRVVAEREAWKARAEKAEADNAALLMAGKFVDAWLYNTGSFTPFSCSGAALCGRCRGCTVERLHQAVVRDHPGAALLEKLRCHEANLEAGALVAKEFDKAGVGNPRDGVLTRALALLERLGAADDMRDMATHSSACRKGFTGQGDPEFCRVCAYDALKGGGQ